MVGCVVRCVWRCVGRCTRCLYVQGACWVYGLVVDARAAEGIAVAIADERRLLVDGYAEDIGAAGLQVADDLVRLEFEDVDADAMVDDEDRGRALV